MSAPKLASRPVWVQTEKAIRLIRACIMASFNDGSNSAWHHTEPEPEVPVRKIEAASNRAIIPIFKALVGRRPTEAEIDACLVCEN